MTNFTLGRLNYKGSDDLVRPRVPIQAETTTGDTYRRPTKTTAEFRPRVRRFYKMPTCPVQTLSVHRSSYKPTTSKHFATKVDYKHHRIDEFSHRSKFPIEHFTTYKKYYGGNEVSEQPTNLSETTEIKRAHDY